MAIICSVDKYGKHNKKCNRLAKWIYKLNGKPYCGIHARQFLRRGLWPVWQEEEKGGTPGAGR
jgi:hypothetical protein